MQNEVVSEVNALSALLYAAAINPSINVIDKVISNPLFNAIWGKSKSVFSLPFKKGIKTSFFSAKVNKRAPRIKKIKVTKTNIKLKQPYFFELHIMTYMLDFSASYLDRVRSYK